MLQLNTNLYQFHLRLTNFYPLSLINLTMNTFWKKWVRMVLMLVGYVPHQGLPFCKNQALKTPYSRCRTPVNVISYTFCPILDSFTAFLFTGSKNFFNKTFGNMPLVKKNAWLQGATLLYTSQFLCADQIRRLVLSILQLSWGSRSISCNHPIPFHCCYQTG